MLQKLEPKRPIISIFKKIILVEKQFSNQFMKTQLNKSIKHNLELYHPIKERVQRADNGYR